MEPTYFAQYRGFEFQCSPERLGDHAFAPRLVIYDASEALTLEIPLGVPTPHAHMDVEEAVPPAIGDGSVRRRHREEREERAREA